MYLTIEWQYARSPEHPLIRFTRSLQALSGGYDGAAETAANTSASTALPKSLFTMSWNRPERNSSWVQLLASSACGFPRLHAMMTSMPVACKKLVWELLELSHEVFI